VAERQPSSLKRLTNAANYSRQGFIQAYHGEAAFREEVYVALVLIPLACLLDVSSVERILLIGSVLLLLIVELLNSAVEAAIDRIGSEHHELSGKAKDMGSAAVLLAVTIVALTWGITLF
tara:strand:- start:4469 stop:4828 length:360 start_codon:yes stop_codon:yes gene_type:complete